MLKSLIAGFIILVAVMAVIGMYRGTAADAERRGREVQMRPAKIKELKRAAVRDACIKHSDWDGDTCEAMDQKQVMIGMTAEQVRLAWGKPERVNTTVSISRHREQWVYGPDYIYLDEGVLSSMQTSRNAPSRP
jgi:hypothetical protein